MLQYCAIDLDRNFNLQYLIYCKDKNYAVCNAPKSQGRDYSEIPSQMDGQEGFRNCVLL